MSSNAAAPARVVEVKTEPQQSISPTTTCTEATKRHVSVPKGSEEPDLKRIKTDPTTTPPPVVNPVIVDSKKETASNSSATSATTSTQTKAEGGPTVESETADYSKASTNLATITQHATVPSAVSTTTKATAGAPAHTVVRQVAPAAVVPLQKPPLTEAEPQQNSIPHAVMPQQKPASVPPPSSSVQPPPLKALKMTHLRTKYTGELEYMLREFRKLERQLLGAKGATQIEESAGSRERREKLHSFILHLEDTIRQIELGCKLEAEGKTTIHVSVGGPESSSSTVPSSSSAAAMATKSRAEASALSRNLPQEKQEEENVQKIEEHILANLLPVKVRLKKQLAAQQGATRNPAGMPATRRGMLQPSEAADRGKGTFAAAAEQRRKEAEALAAAHRQPLPAEPVHPDKTHFGKPLGRRGSSLTQKLHGETLGSKGRPHGHGVGLPQPDNDEAKVMYGGMAPGSSQVASGMAKASSVHTVVTDSQHLKPEQPTLATATPSLPLAKLSTVPASKTEPSTAKAIISVPFAPSTAQHPDTEPTLASRSGQPVPEKPRAAPKPTVAPQAAVARPPISANVHGVSETGPSATTMALKEKLADPNLSEEEHKKLRRKLKKKMFLRRVRRREFERQRQTALLPAVPSGGHKVAPGRKKSLAGKLNGKKRGPRSVEYICALCSENYGSVCEYNPWWALAQHECPKCRKTQIPRVDISAPANAIEYHPALLAHADDNNGGSSAAPAPSPASDKSSNLPQAHIPAASKFPASAEDVASGEKKYGSDSEFWSDLSDITDGNLSDISLDSNDSDADLYASLTPAEKAECERFGFEYKGPTLSDSEAGKLLVLMLHANGCPCRHKNPKQREVCKSVKYMMLHVRDCPGTTSTFDVCPFPWCRKVKHLMYHLVSCTKPDACPVCSPSDLNRRMKDLVGLNRHRLQRQRERMIAAYNASAAARQEQQQQQQQQQPQQQPRAPDTTQSSTPAAPPKKPGVPRTLNNTTALSNRAKPVPGPAEASKLAENAERNHVAEPQKPVTATSNLKTSASNAPNAPPPASHQLLATQSAPALPKATNLQVSGQTPVVSQSVSTPASALQTALTVAQPADPPATSKVPGQATLSASHPNVAARSQAPSAHLQTGPQSNIAAHSLAHVLTPTIEPAVNAQNVSTSTEVKAIKIETNTVASSSLKAPILEPTAPPVQKAQFSTGINSESAAPSEGIPTLNAVFATESSPSGTEAQKPVASSSACQTEAQPTSKEIQAAAVPATSVQNAAASKATVAPDQWHDGKIGALPSSTSSVGGITPFAKTESATQAAAIQPTPASISAATVQAAPLVSSVGAPATTKAAMSKQMPVGTKSQVKEEPSSSSEKRSSSLNTGETGTTNTVASTESAERPLAAATGQSGKPEIEQCVLVPSGKDSDTTQNRPSMGTAASRSNEQQASTKVSPAVSDSCQKKELPQPGKEPIKSC